MAAEFVLAAATTVCFAAWYWYFGGASAASAVLRDNRGTLYGTTASIFGSLLGFVITATSVVIGFSGSERLAVVRDSGQFPMLGKTFRAVIRALAAATLTALVCLLLDRDNSPFRTLLILMFFTTTLALLRMARTIWILEQIIMLVTRPADDQRSQP